MPIFRTCLLALFALLMSNWHAANAATPLRSLQFEHIKSKQGLPGSVTDIVQDAQGYIWIAGQQGLSRFDGYKFSLYKNQPEDPSSLDDNWVRSLHVDKIGRLWVGTNRGGLHLYDPSKNNFQRFYSSDPSNSNNKHSLRAIISDGEGGLWLASRSGLKYFNPERQKFSVFQHDAGNPDSLVDDKLTSLVMDANKNLWIGTTQGLDRKKYGSQQFEHFQLAGTPAQQIIRSLMIDHSQRLWVGTNYSLELWTQLQGQPERRRFGEDDNLLSGVFLKIYEDRNYGIWLSLADRGLQYWNEASQKFSSFQHQPGIPESLSDNQVEALYQDRSGSLWVGTWSGGGVNRVDLASGGFTNFAYLPPGTGMEADSKATSIIPGKDQLLWISTWGKGIKLYDPDNARELKSIRQSKVGDQRIDDMDIVSSLHKDIHGQIWAATRAGLGHLDAQTRQLIMRAYNKDEPSLKTSINQMRMDGDGRLWLASINGLMQLDTRTDKLVSFKHKADDPDSISNDYVSSILLADNSTLWVATIKGLNLLDTSSGKFRRFHHNASDQHSLMSDNVFHIFTDSKKQLWLGTETGLSKLTGWKGQQAQFINYPSKQAVNCILEDSKGVLWMSQESDISRFNPATGEFKNYTYEDGLGELGYYANTCHQDKLGNMYFGGPSGLISFKPEDIRDNPHAPQVLLTDLKIFNQSVSTGKFPDGFSMQGQIQDAKEITLGHQHAIFSLEFSALHYADTQRNQFAYQLQGFDQDWVLTDASKRFASYTNLDPGTYTFKVKAANKDGVWNETGRSLKITVLPPFWQTIWFRLLLGSSLLAIIWLAYLWRVRTLIQQKQALEAEVNIRTMEVSAQKEELEKTNQALLRVNKRQEAQQSELTRFLAVASHDLRQPMHALNLYLGALSNFELPATVKPVLNNLRHCARTMDDMFANLLDLSRLDAQIVEPQWQEFGIAEVLGRLEVEFTPQALVKGLHFHIQHSMAVVRSDPALVEQILRNLIANAIRYTPAGQVIVNCQESGDQLQIAVEDSGIGISLHDQETIFEEFFQVESQRSAKGMGLGLAIVQRLVRLLHIPIQLRSQPGQGSTFAISLPLSMSQDMREKQSRSKSVVTASLLEALIVVIEDDESILMAMRALLEQWDGRVITATSGAQALAMCSEEIKIPDLLICDYRLNRNENGIDVVSNLREEFNHHIPAILITGDISPQLAEDAKAAELILMHKPIQAEVLHDVVSQMLNEAKQ
ncbi:two-component regulator propeller domain-containing protein [Undibacterium sp. Di27W]|uniref:two-component regulator propeller domain-containing protein n=1 Tax=Undibacterium sp. Di27W TaxID=3413036 RepID=UPI003BF39C0B